MTIEHDVEVFLDDHFKKSVNEFIETFDVSRDPKLWAKLVDEESKELREAYTNLSKEIADVEYVLSGLKLATQDLDDIEQINLLGDTVKSLEVKARGFPDYTQTLAFYVEVFDAVHQSNMSKLGDDGKPIKREDGKILKGPNYKEPDLSFIFNIEDM